MALTILTTSKKTVQRIVLSSLALLVIVAGMSYAFLRNGPEAGAVGKEDWNAGYIIDDSVFYNENAQSVNDIQNFLNSKVPSCDTNGSLRATEYGRGDLTHAQYAAMKGWQSPPYSCLKDFKQDTQQIEAASSYCNAIPGGSAVSAAQIIYNVARACHINPQVLIVLIQKEQSLVLDTWPLNSQYKTATGYGCPDTAACDSKYFGFFNQVYNAAKQFQIYKKFPNDYNYVAGRNNNIYYNPTHSCGSSTVYIQNQATAGLYNYTPYQPNQSALDNLYGSGDGCGAYGNRNFWRLFNDWFGTTQSHAIGNNVKAAYKSQFGYATSEESCGIKDNGCYQIFKNGVTIYWSNSSGAHAIAGGIRAKWGSSGSEYSQLGYPITDEQYGNRGGGAYQTFQGGRIYYTNEGTSYIILNSMLTKWSQLNAEWGVLGYPTNDTICGINGGGCYQMFQHNIAIYWTESSGAHTIAGGIRAKWGSSGSEYSQLGYPITDEQYGNKGGGAYQTFQGGKIYYTNQGKSFIVLNNIVARWNQSNAEWGVLGYPITDTICGINNGGCYQMFDNNIAVYWSPASGAHTIAGGIRATWGANGSEWSRLGYPITDEQYGNNTAYQDFQGGRITWYANGSPSTITYNQ